MSLLSDIILQTHAISQRVEVEKSTSLDNGVNLSPKEQAKSLAAKNRVIRALESITQSLKADFDPTQQKSASYGLHEQELPSADVQPSPDTVLKEGMSDKPEGLGGQAMSLNKMAEAIGPIISTFDSVLSKPYLKYHNATLTSTTPIVGLKGDNIMYIETQSTAVGIKDVWSIFSPVPEGANVNSSVAVHFFPYQGDFIMAVGTTLWRKKHRSDLGRSSDDIRQASIAWPKLYHDEWEKIGDKCLPDGNLRSIIPYALLSAAGNQIKFHLLILTQDGTLQVLDGSDLGPNNTFVSMNNISKDAAKQGLVMHKAAYWNGKIIGYDDAGYTWNLYPDFNQRTIEAKDKQQVEPIKQLTATDIGPVGVQKDGFLWIRQDNVVNLGVASPGVMLDLETLTKSLKDRYITTQTALYPVVNKIKTFAVTHKFFLNSLSETAKELQNSSSDETKNNLKIASAKKFVSHAKVWATLLKTQSEYGGQSVNVMGQDLSSVKTQLSQQLSLLKDKMTALTAQLKALKDAESKIKAAFWISIAVAVVGLGLTILALCTGVGAVYAIAAGGLFVGGLVAVGIFAKRWADISDQISKVEAQLRDVTTASEELEFVVKNFSDLEDMYGKLSQFWGKMFNSAVSLQGMDKATALQLGAGILEDPSSIDAAKDVTRQMEKACDVYLAVLNGCGIRLPRDDSDDEEEDAAGDLVSTTDAASASVEFDQTFYNVVPFNNAVSDACAALKEGDFDLYTLKMRDAYTIDAHSITSQNSGTTLLDFEDVLTDERPSKDIASAFIGSAIDSSVSGVTGVPLIDIIPEIFRSKIAIMSSSLPFTLQDPQSNRLNGLLVKARTEVVSLLDQTIELGTISQEWVARMPDLPTTNEDRKMASVYRDKAGKNCKEAQASARLANNAFVDFNHEATELQQSLERRIVKCRDDIRASEASRRSLLDSVNIPTPVWFIPVAGPLIGAIATGVNRSKIDEEVSRCERQINDLSLEVVNLEFQRNVGALFMGQTQTWMDFCQKASRALGSIYNDMTAIKLQIKYELEVDPKLWKQVTATEWSKVRRDAEECKALIGSAQETLAADFDLAVSSKRADSALLQAVTPSMKLMPELQSQVANSRIVWSEIQKLRELNYSEDIVAYLDPETKNKTTVFDMVDNIRTTYIQMAATQYNTVQQLYTLALIQEARSKNAASGAIPMHIFLKHTFSAIETAKKNAAQTKKTYAYMANNFRERIALTRRNVAELRTAITVANLDKARRDQDYRDKINGIIIQGALTAFATGGLVAAAAAAAYVGVPLASVASVISAGGVLFGGTRGNGGETTGEEIDGNKEISNREDTKNENENPDGHEDAAAGHNGEPEEGFDTTTAAKDADTDTKKPDVKQHKLEATELGKRLLDKLSLPELAMLVALVEVAISVMERTVAAMETLQKPLQKLVEGIVELSDIISDMDDTCDQLAHSLDFTAPIPFTKQDASAVAEKWQGVSDACEVWLDLLNEQRISPISFSQV
ncbi:hypothetical protein INS49_013129 [Diaporthe citri]|uniref:uncharacterized protein n=1 Tax=Diaporthe citri TaxID=83186 RepID=UPI001C7EBB14|nr:uncharacterized protein INS49_013129 [Diaporthe citri]KAG6359607.1 hypothetical protein INS49_013129 [Diaporthe citri]